MSVASQSETRNVDRILAFTRDAIESQVRDQAFNDSPLVSALCGKMLGDFGARKGMTSKRTQTGAESIVVRANLGKNTSVKNKSGPWDTNNTTPSDTVRYSRAEWKFYSIPVVVSDHDLRVNVGPEALSSLLTHETENAMRSLADKIGDHLYNNSGAASAVSDLDSIISANDTIQGLSGSTYPTWNSRGLSPRGTAPASVSFAGGSFAVTGLQNWRIAYNNASEGATTPDAAFTTWDLYGYYEGALQPQERFTNTTLADGGFVNLAFKKAPIFPDDKCTSGSTLFLNWNALEFVVLAGADFSMGEWVRVENQSARVMQIETTANLVVKSRKFLNKVTGQTA